MQIGAVQEAWVDGIAIHLRRPKNLLRLWSTPAVSAILVAMVLLQMAMAASEPLHKLIHADADQPGHECSVTLFAHGQIESASVDVPFVLPATGIDLTPQAPVSFYRPAPQDLPPGRGPPALCLPS